MTASRSKSPRKNHSKVLVIDDQPFELNWLFEFITESGFSWESAVNLRDGVELIRASENDKYRVLIVDMEIGTGGYVWKAPKEPTRAALYQKYPGLAAVQEARNYDYNSSNVLVYSVHQSADINAEVSLLRCRYMLKGRPRGFKEIIRPMLGIGPRTP
jgi:hypothetical protein